MSSNPTTPTDELTDDARSDEVNRLLGRLFEMSRPIADGFHEPGLDMRLGDPERFFEIIRGLERLHYPGIEQSLLMLLDEFAQLEQGSYNELYLWSIVELSRRQGDHVEMLWPMVLTLDLRFRGEPWERPGEFTLRGRPYRLIELVMFYYVYATIEQEHEIEQLYDPDDGMPLPQPRTERRRYPPLATCLRRLQGHLSDEQDALMMNTLRELYQNETARHPAFGDAHGLLLRGR